MNLWKFKSRIITSKYKLNSNYLNLPTWKCLEKSTAIHPVKKFPAYYRNPRFIKVFTKDRYRSLSWTRRIQATTTHPIISHIYLRFIMLMSSRYDASSGCGCRSYGRQLQIHCMGARLGHWYSGRNVDWGWEQGAEENIWFEERWSNGRLEKTINWELHNLCF
jgi:hypothetical protein